MLRNLVIDTATGRTVTGAPLGADIVDVVLRADAFGKSRMAVGAIYLYAGTLSASECRAWLGVTGGPVSATARLELEDNDTGESLMVLTKQGMPGDARAAADLIIAEPGWYSIWLSSTNKQATASVYGLHLTFRGAV